MIFKYIRQQKISFGLLIVSSLFWAAQQAVMPIILRRVINIGIEFKSNETVYISINSSMIVLIIIYIFAEFVIRAQGILIANFMPKFRNNIKSYYLDLIMSFNCSYMASRASGYIADKINTVATSTERILQILIYNFLSMSCSLCLVSFLLFLIEPIYSLLLTVWFITHFCITVFRLRSGLPHVELHSNKYSQLSGMITECLDRISLIKIFGSHEYEIDRINVKLNEEAKLLSSSGIYFEKSKILQGILTIFLLVGIIGVLIYSLNTGKISLGNFAFVIFSVFNIVNYIWFSAFQLTVFFKEYGSLMNSLKILWQPGFKDNLQSIKKLDAGKLEIRIENLGIFNINNKNLLRNVEFVINPDDNILICGRSGIGKSTLAKILVGIHTEYSGNVYINNVNLHKYSFNDIRQEIILVEQQSKLFTGTLLENIIYNAQSPSLQELRKVLNLTFCEEMINNFIHGLDTNVQGVGTNLSGGQIQRICIARALLAKPKILILDEATTGLDQEMAKHIIKNLFTIKDLTTIVISHNIELELNDYRLINLERFSSLSNEKSRVKNFVEL